jgi:hypothetical protein
MKVLKVVDEVLVARQKTGHRNPGALQMEDFEVILKDSPGWNRAQIHQLLNHLKGAGIKTRDELLKFYLLAVEVANGKHSLCIPDFEKKNGKGTFPRGVSTAGVNMIGFILVQMSKLPSSDVVPFHDVRREKKRGKK